MRRASQEYGDRIRGIILYGSVTRDSASEDSDIDLLVVIDEEDFRLLRELVGLSFEILLVTGGDLLVKVLSDQDFLARKSHSFLRNVLAEGAVRAPGTFTSEVRFATPGIRLVTLVVERGGERFTQDLRLDVLDHAWVG